MHTLHTQFRHPCLLIQRPNSVLRLKVFIIRRHHQHEILKGFMMMSHPNVIFVTKIWFQMEAKACVTKNLVQLETDYCCLKYKKNILKVCHYE